MNFQLSTIFPGMSKRQSSFYLPFSILSKNIHLGPTPAFLSPNVAKVLVDNFGIAGIGSVEEDLKLFGLSE